MPHAAKILFLCTFAVHLAPLVAQCRATVDGRVVDEHNLPVSDAEVFVVEDAKSQVHGTLNPLRLIRTAAFMRP